MSEVAATISSRAPVRLEEITHANVTPATQPAGRAISAVEADHDRDRTEPPARADHRGDRLDRARGAGAGDPAEQAQERGGPAAPSSSVDRGPGVARDAIPDVPRPGGSDPVLRAGATPLRVDRDRLEPG